MAKKRRRKGKAKRKTRHIPLPILKKRLAKLERIVKSRS